jgi:hypothetical protein
MNIYRTIELHIPKKKNSQVYAYLYTHAAVYMEWQQLVKPNNVTIDDNVICKV